MSERERSGRAGPELRPVWVPLDLKSHYSIGLGTASVRELVDRLASDGVQAAALSDVDNLYALPRFHAACLERGIRPLTGVELTEPPKRPPVVPVERRRLLPPPSQWHMPNTPRSVTRSRVVLLARDHSGYERICRLLSLRSRLENDAHDASDAPLLPRMLAEIGSDGLFTLTDDPWLARTLVEEGTATSDAVRLLLVRPAPRIDERRLRATSEQLGLVLVADPDPTYLDPQDHRLHLLARAIRAGTAVDSAALEGGAPSAVRALPGPEDVRRLYADVPGALDETLRVALECRHTLLGRRLPLPRPPHVAEDDAPGLLASRIRERLARARATGRCTEGRYTERVEKELDALATRGLSGYLLVLAEILEGARGQGIPVAGRGSAVASLVGHLLGLSPVDPVAEGLYFERFLHRRRSDLPDIDVNVSAPRRDQLIEWTHDHFGREHVALASAVHRFGWRSAWREGLQALGVTGGRAERILAAIPSEPNEPEPSTGLPLDDLPTWAPEVIRRLVGQPRHIAMHPGGVVVTPVPIDQVAPVETLPDGRRMLHYDAASLSALGVPKVDLLGSRALAEIEVAIALLDTTSEMDPELRSRLTVHGPAAVPLDDPETLALLDRGDTLGIPELETAPVRATLEQIPIRRTADVVAALALVRPGASSGRAKIRYVRRARGEIDPRRGRWPLLERVLSETHGVVLYEEDLMRVIAEATGVDVEEADRMRRDLVDRQDDLEALTRMEEDFVWMASARGVELQEATALWTELVRFAAYSFNKAHAAGHALLAYQGAFFRTHAPVAFACGVLDHHEGSYPLRTISAAIGRWGVSVRHPDVTRSFDRTVPEGETAVRLGLNRVKGLSAVTSRRVAGARASGGPYGSLADFMARARPSITEATALLMVGACDALEPLDASLYPFLHEGVAEALRSRAASIDHVTRELADHLRRRLAGREPGRVERYRALVRVRNELDLLEMHLSFHPMRVLRAEADALGCITAIEAAGAVGARVKVAALLGAARRVATRRHRRLRFLTLEDESGLVEALLRPALESAQGHRVTTPGPYLVDGIVRDDHGHSYLDVLDIEPFHWRRAHGEQARAEVGSSS